METEQTIEQRLSVLTPPRASRLHERQGPECPWCGRKLSPRGEKEPKWGWTCDHRCYDAWVQKILPRREEQGGDEWTAKTLDHPPLPESQQPWTRPRSR